jgi:two-component system, LytTR family, response regulator
MKNGIKAIIVEDVESYLFTIEKMIEEVAPQVVVAGKSTTLSKAKELIKNVKPDAVLLDIQFEMEGKTAFDLLNELSDENLLNFQIIFITAHQESKYYSQAFNFNALHFIEKPIDKEKLREALKRAENTITSGVKPLLTQIGELHKKMNLPFVNEKIVVEGNLYSEIISVGEIAMIEASGRYSVIYLSNGKNIVSCKNLGEYEKQMAQYGNFIRIHKNRIINYNMVRRYSRKDRLIELFEPLGKYVASKERFREFIEFTGGKKE